MLSHGLYVWVYDKVCRIHFLISPLPFEQKSMENAGGRATTGSKRILDIVPDKIHQRSPIFMGSADDVEDIEQVYREHPN